MSRSSAALFALTLAACGAPTPAPAVAVPAPVAPPPAAVRFVAEQDKGKSSLRGLDAHESEVWRVPLVGPTQWVAAPDGHVFAVVPAASGKGRSLVSVDAQGQQRPLHALEGEGHSVALVDGRVAVFRWVSAGYQHTDLVLLVLSTDGEVLIDATVERASKERDPVFSARGEVAVALIGGAARLRPGGGAPLRIGRDETHAPPGERGVRDVATTAIAFLPDGGLLTGAADGTVSAFDEMGARRWSLGLRGAIRGLTRVDDDRWVVTTRDGVIALVDRGGRLRWERRATLHELGAAAIADGGLALAGASDGVFAYSLGGDLVFSHDVGAEPLGDETNTPPVSVTVRGDEVIAETAGHRLRFRLGDPHPRVPDATPSYPLRFERVHDAAVDELLALGPREIWALARGTEVTPGRALRFDGARFRPVSMPPLRDVILDGIAVSPEGRAWITARRVDKKLSNENVTAGIPRVFEWDGRAIRERDIVPDAPVVTERFPAAIGARASLLCFTSEACFEHRDGAFRALKGPANIGGSGFTAVIGRSRWVLDYGGGTLSRRDGAVWSDHSSAIDMKVATLAGTADDDVWAGPAWRRGMYHFDGRAWRWQTGPMAGVGHVWAATRDSVWAEAGGRLFHFDGRTWSSIGGAYGAVHAIAGAARDEVWIATTNGIWRAVPGEPPLLRLPAARTPDDRAPPAPVPLTIGEPDDRLRAVRVTLPVAGGSPLTDALGVTSAAGVTWLRAWDRVVEVDERRQKASVLLKARVQRCPRCALPEAHGKGHVMLDGELRRVDGKRLARLLPQIEVPEALGGASGRLFVVGQGSGDFSARALVMGPDGLRPALGLPAAAWADVAVADDGAIFAVGGVSSWSAASLPVGEGVLLHVRGAASTRVRAAGSLLAVAAVSPEEAWAVGAGGTVVHVKAGAVERFALPSGEWLRAVWAAGADDVWMGGDGGTLIHFDGRTFRRVSTAALGLDASITGIGGPSRDRLWVASPSGLLRLVRHTGAPP